MSGASAGEARQLYRQLLRTGRAFTSYNVREYVLRRTRDGFRHNRALAPAQAQVALADGRKQLEVARRQAVVYGLFTPAMKSIMEVKMPRLR